MKRCILALLAFSMLLQTVRAQENNSNLWEDKNFEGLEWRSIGPALMAGRIADIAIHPQDESIWYVAVGSGGVWKTMNSGVTWEPIFDDQSVFSTGCVTIDPGNPSVMWVGTGEKVAPQVELLELAETIKGAIWERMKSTLLQVGFV
jgi:hypothetical protein